jgi:hypothetical protein
MPISRERMTTRLEELKSQLEQIRQQFIATTGAITDLEYWLAENLPRK